jgi:hypothetical protein
MTIQVEFPDLVSDVQVVLIKSFSLHQFNEKQKQQFALPQKSPVINHD